MKLINTLILALIVVIVGGFVYFYEIKGGEDRARQKEIAKQLFDVEPDSIKSIRLKPANIELKKVSGEWEVVQPLWYRADGQTVNSFLNSISSAKRERELDEDRSRHSDFGLDPAKATVVLEYRNRIDTLYLGDHSPASPFVYARIGNRPHVLLTNQNLSRFPKKPLFEWRNKELLSFNKDKTQQLKLSTPTARFELRKDDGDKWHLVSPIATLADQDEVNRVINRIRNALVKEFVAEATEQPGRFGLDNPNYQLTILEESGEPKTIMFGGRIENGYYAHNSVAPQIFLVDTNVVSSLQVTAFDLRNKKLTDFESHKIDYLELNYRDTLSIVCKKDSASQWQIHSPQPEKAKSWKISNIARALASLEANEFVSENAENLKPYSLDNPRATIIAKQQEVEVARVWLGREKENYVYAKSANSPPVVLVKKDEAGQLIVTLNDLIESNK